MSYRVRYSPRALDDLDIIWDDVYEASLSAVISDRYVKGIISEIGSKHDYPKSGQPLYYGSLFTGYYTVNFKAYKIFYRINNDCIEVARVLLQKQDYLNILFGNK